ncbi:MAG: NUDIX domain-containing protein [Micromonosporaceae bacterium]|nr:NUDIX domain-containing protein [Micromonosporaceae bacterium]
MTLGLEPLRRIASYAVCTDGSERVLLVRGSASSGTPGAWSLPGGAVDHGEHPGDTVVRETAAETGLSVTAGPLRDVLTDVRDLRHRGMTIHTDRLVYDVRLRGGSLIERIGQPTDLARWVTLTEAKLLPLRPFTAAALGLPTETVDSPPDRPPELPSFLAVRGADGLHRAQRFAAYAVATDLARRLLLTEVAAGFPGAGRWHLPGGGTDFGEQPPVALLRELHEETGQSGRVEELLGVASHRDAASLGPEGYPIDWHGVRAFYRVRVHRPTVPRVAEHGGSTARAGWFTRAELAGLSLTEAAAEALRA